MKSQGGTKRKRRDQVDQDDVGSQAQAVKRRNIKSKGRSKEESGETKGIRGSKSRAPKETSRGLEESQKGERACSKTKCAKQGEKADVSGARATRLRLARPFLDPSRDVYVTKDRAKFGAYRARALALLRTAHFSSKEQDMTKEHLNKDCVKLVGSGAAMATACEVALWVEENMRCKIDKHIETGSLQVADLASSCEKEPFSMSERTISSITITLRKLRE